MKKILTILLLSVATMASAQYPHHNHRHGGWGYNGWIAPVIVSGVIGYEIARNQTPPPVIVQQPVIVQPVPPATVYYGQTQNCTVWTEVQQPDGTITRTRTCSQ